MIGTFVVPVGDLRWDQMQDRMRTTGALNKAIKDLEDIRDGKAVGPTYL